MSSIVTKALIADHQPLFRQALSSVLHEQLGVADCAHVGDWAGVIGALRLDPSLVLAIVDLDLAGMSKLEGVRYLRVVHPAMLLVVVSAVSNRQLALDVVSAGAHGFVPKDSEAGVVELALRTVLSGTLFVPSLVAEVGKVPPAPASADAAQLLTERQREVLRLLATGQSNKAIARTLHIAEGTVKVHVTAAFRQLGVHNRVSAAHMLRSCPPAFAAIAEQFTETEALPLGAQPPEAIQAAFRLVAE